MVLIELLKVFSFQLLQVVSQQAVAFLLKAGIGRNCRGHIVQFFHQLRILFAQSQVLFYRFAAPDQLGSIGLGAELRPHTIIREDPRSLAEDLFLHHFPFDLISALHVVYHLSLQLVLYKLLGDLTAKAVGVKHHR